MLKGVISYWIVPLFSASVWLAMLLAMLLTWVTDGSPHLPSMPANTRIPYISDIGAWELKPLFITMGAITVVTFDLSLIFERWLRHSGRLAHNTSWFQKMLAILAIISAIVGAAGLILLTIFDTLRHHTLHDVFLCVFIGGYIVSAIFTCWEYQRLGVKYRQHRILAASFWIKLAFILVEFVLAIAFGVTEKQQNWNVSGILEWVIALIFTFYVLSYFVDFLPALQTKHHRSTEDQVEMAQADSESNLHPSYGGVPAGRYYGNGYPAQQTAPPPHHF